MAKAVEKVVDRIKALWAGNRLTITLPRGDSFVLNTDNLSADVKRQAMEWGLRQKVVNGFAPMMKGDATRWDDIAEEIQRRIRALQFGHWSHADVGQRFGDMVRAFVEKRAAAGKPIDYADAELALMKLSEDQRKPIYDDPAIRVRMLEIAAERLRAAPQIPTEPAANVLDLI